MINSKNVRSFIGLSSLLAIAASSFACSAPSGEESVEARVETIDRAHQALGSGTLQWANGTYGAGCTSRSGSWSARISGVAAMDHAALSVVKNNTDCVLTLTGLVADASYAGSPSIDMTNSYASSGSAFASGGNVEFYANARLSSLSFASSFTVSILFSDNLADTSPNVSATYASVSSSATATQVPAPTYTADFDGTTLQTDQGGIVQLSSGNVAMTASGQTGEAYVISSDQSLGSSFAAIDAAYGGAGMPSSLGNYIDLAQFNLDGEQLPTVRNLIISHTVSGVAAYEVIRVTFNAP